MYCVHFLVLCFGFCFFVGSGFVVLFLIFRDHASTEPHLILLFLKYVFFESMENVAAGRKRSNLGS